MLKKASFSRLIVKITKSLNDCAFPMQQGEIIRRETTFPPASLLLKFLEFFLAKIQGFFPGQFFVS
jgi:hypothetical protein